MPIQLFKEMANEISIIELPIEEIKPSPYRQRKYIDFYSLNRLTESIRKYGVLQPITVRVVNGRHYEIVAGERRLRAARAAGMESIPCVFIDADEEESTVFAFTENLQRKNLSFLEEVEGCRSLMKDFGMMAEEISMKTGIPLSVVNTRMKILDMPEEALQLIMENEIDEDSVKAVLRIPDDELRLTALKEIVEQDMTVKKSEDYVDKILFCMRFGSHSQNIKATIKDMKIFTNSIKQTVEMARNAGIPAYYDATENENELIINIKILS